MKEEEEREKKCLAEEKREKGWWGQRRSGRPSIRPDKLGPKQSIKLYTFTLREI